MTSEIRGLQENPLWKITFIIIFVLQFHYRSVSATTISNNVLIVSPLKKGMYPTPSYQSSRTSDFEEPFAIFEIPIQSTVNLTIDLRHIRNFTIADPSIAFYYAQQWQILISVSETLSDLSSGSIAALNQFPLTIPQIFTRNTTNKTDAHLFRLFAYSHLYLSLNILILDASLSSMRSEFFQCASIAIHQPQRAITGTNSMFAFVIKNNGAVNLPRNLPTLNSDYTYPDTLLTYSTLDSSEALQTLNLTTATKRIQLSNDQFWQTRQQLVIPYIPYISNCKSYGEYIYLHDVIENKDICSLYNLTQTKPINPIGFGQTAISDTCDQVVFECLLDEAYSDVANYPKFYTLAKLSQVFFITGDPIVIDDSMLSMTTSMANLIPVVLQNEFSTTYLPKNIDLVINYYQIDKKTKKIITAAMTFNNLILITNLNQTQPFQYNFTFSLHSMSQAELAIAFALQWPVYLLLSVIIGSFSIVFISLYYAIFKIANWISRRQVQFRDESPPFKWTFKSLVAKIKAGSHYFLFYEPIIIGIFLGFIPSFILHVIASMAMLGQFWSYPLQTCTTLTTDELCERSLIEAVMSVSLDQSTRRGRLGFSLIIIGAYACLRIIGIFIPNDEETLIREEVEKVQNTSRGKRSNFIRAMKTVWEQEPILVTESFDGNTWFYNTWKRGLFCFMTIFILIIMLVILNLSFSTYFGANQWTFTVILKLTQIFIEESFKIFMENEILLGSLSCVIAMTLSVSGLGATDFFAYLTTYFVNLGISTFEKVNQVLVVDFISDNAFEGAEKLNKWIQKQMEPEFEEKQDNSEINPLLNTQLEPPTKDALEQVELAESANSDIILSEKYEESFDSYLGNIVIDTTPQLAIDGIDCTKTVATSPTKRNPTSGKLQSKKTQAKPKETIPKISSSSECDTEEDDDAFELRFKRALNLRLAKTQESNVASFKSKQYTLREAQLQHQQKQQGESKGNGNATGEQFNGSEQEQEDEMNHQVKIYGDFCNNTFNLFQTPFEVVQMWMFYDSSQSFVKWGITKAGLFFYFLFTVANIPFQIITDLIFLKTVQQFHRIRINEYVELNKQRYNQRKFNWKVLDQTDFLPNIDDDLQYIDVWSYSSQYFFCLSLFVAGAMLIINGILTIQANSYNTFSDTYIVTITLFWFWMCAVIDFGCIWVYKHTKLWKINNDTKKEQEGTQQQQQQQQQQAQQLIPSQDKLEPDIVDKHINNNNEFSNYLRTGEEWLKSNQKELQNQQYLQQSQLPRSPANQSELNMKTQVANAFQNALISRNHSKINVLSSQSLFDPQEGDHFMKSKKREDIPRLQDQPQYVMFQQMMNKQPLQIQLMNKFVPEHSLQLSPSQRQSMTMFLKSKKSRMSMQKQQASLHSWVYSHEATINQTIKSNIILEISYLKQILSQSRLMKEFIENLVEETKDSDLGVHSYLVNELCPVESWNLTIEDRFGQLESQQLNKSAKNQLRNKKSWMSFKDNFKQAIELQAKTAKLKEQKLILQANEFQDERFRRKFLKRNKKWFRDNISILFEDIMIGEAFSQIKKYRPMILKEFSNIFGEIPGDNKIIQTEVKEEDAQKSNYNKNVKISVNSLNRVKFIVRYWSLRARILKFAENCIGGLMLRGGDKTTCDYCRNNWGLTAQLAVSSIEDMFLCFVKKTVKRDFLELELFVNYHDSNSFQFRVESQRFIEAWQEYFLENARFVSICLECNNDAQNAFEERIQQKRRKNEELLEEEKRKKLAILKIKEKKNKNSLQEDVRSSFSSFHSQSQFLQLSQNNLMQSQQQQQFPLLQSPNQWETRMVESQEIQNSKEMDSPPFAPSIHLRKSSNNIPSLHELQLLDESLQNIAEHSHNRRSSLIFRKHHNSKQKMIASKNQNSEQSHSDGEDFINKLIGTGNLIENENNNSSNNNIIGTVNNPNTGGVTNLGKIVHSNLLSGGKQLAEKSSLVIVEDVNEDVSYGFSKMNSFAEDFKLGPQNFHRENSNRQQRMGSIILRQLSYQQQQQNNSRNSSHHGSDVQQQQQQQTHPDISIAKSQLAEEEEDDYDRDDGTNNQKGQKKQQQQDNKRESQNNIEKQNNEKMIIISNIDSDDYDNKDSFRLQPPPNTNIRNFGNHQSNISNMLIDGSNLLRNKDYEMELESPQIQLDSPDFGLRQNIKKKNNNRLQLERMSLVGLLSPNEQLLGSQSRDVPQYDTYEHDVGVTPQTLQTDENDKLHSTEYTQRQQINVDLNSK